MYKDKIGMTSSKIKNNVERGAVKRFAEAIGDANPIYFDEEIGKNSRYGKNIAPPTFARAFDFGVIPGLDLSAKGIIHGQQNYHYERPLFVGEDVLCYTKVIDYYEKNGSSGNMGFIVYENNGEDLSGNTIFTSRIVYIITEAVRKGMSV